MNAHRRWPVWLDHPCNSLRPCSSLGHSGRMGKPRPRTVPFAGRCWAVKDSSEPVGPGPNVFSDSTENVWVDTAGRLHLRITFRGGVWRCAEVILDRSLGYGSYGFTLDSPVGRLDPHVVLGLFSWSDDPAYDHREIDIEFGLWGKDTAENAQYVVQPHDRAGNRRPFIMQADAAPTSHTFTWVPDRVSFHSDAAAGMTIASWRYAGPDVPPSGDERTRINLWLHGGKPPSAGSEVEVALSAFTFTPQSGQPGPPSGAAAEPTT